MKHAEMKGLNRSFLFINFLILPLLGSVVITFFYYLGYTEGLISVHFSLPASNRPDYLQTAAMIIGVYVPEYFAETRDNALLFGLLFSFTIGCAFYFTRICGRNPIAYFPANLSWCIVYATFINLINGVFWIFANYIFPSLIDLPDWFTATMIYIWPFTYMTAILWAAIRSITTDDVLTPRVLRDKLRERARL